MSPVTLSTLLTLLAVSAVHAQAPSEAPPAGAPPTGTTPPAGGAPPVTPTVPAPGGKATYPVTPLAEKRFPYNQLPYKADTEDLIRGIQVGYNQCNQTTEGQESLCQTAIFNSIEDFCLWGPPEPNSLIGDTEGEAVAWCTKPGYGTRLIPEGTFEGLQFMRTPDYIQAVGFIKQTNLNVQEGDYGGELDPHGADLRGNPLGGLVYSNAWSQDKEDFQQVIEWHNFIGSDAFCFKACDPSRPDAPKFCEHIFDRIGCKYNAPNNAKKGVFESCLGDNQDFPGVYTSNGQVMTYTQPPESLGPITTMPYEPRVPASSSCTTYQSSELFSAAPEATGASSSRGSSASGSATGTNTRSGQGSATRSGSAAGASSTTSGASTIAISFYSLAGALFAVALLY